MSEELIRYSANKETLLYVPALSKITISSETTLIKGSSAEMYAFYDARSTIESVNFENNPKLQSISPYCFYYCVKLTSIDLSACTELTQIGEFSFCGCSSLKEISLPSKITNILNHAFAYAGLIQITIPESLKSFGIYVFFCCKSLESFTLHENSINQVLTNHMFTSTKLRSIHLTKYIRSFSGDNFEWCTNMETVSVDDENPCFTEYDNVIYNQEKTILYYCPSKRTGDFIVPSGVTSIHNCAFHGSKITNITFPESLKVINGYAFYQSSITELNLPSSCKTISSNCFFNCTELKSVVLPEGLETIGTECFASCSNLKSVILPSTIKSLGGSAFPTNSKLEFDPGSSLMIDDQSLIMNKAKTEVCQYAGSSNSVRIPNTTQKIKARAFYALELITTVIFEEGSALSTIENYAFRLCTNLANIELPLTIKSIGSYAFQNCRIQKLHFGSALTSIYEHAFSKCIELTILAFDAGDNQVTISEYAFYECVKLKNIDFGDRIKSIGECCFYNTYSLESINIPSATSNIGMKAFSYSGIKRCTFASNSLIDTFDQRLFYSCTALSEINIPDSVVAICEYALSLTSIVNIALPKSTVILKESCFAGCSSLTVFNIPEDSCLTDIEYGVFLGCSSFKEINNDCGNFVIENSALFNQDKTELIIHPQNSDVKYFSFPATLKTIGICALQGCKKLHVIFIPYSVTTIKPYAFDGCSNLKTINIPYTVTSVGFNAFLGCKKLQCGVSVDNQSSAFRNELIQNAHLPERAMIDCNAACSAKRKERGMQSCCKMHQLNIFT